jgi:hypothetical protein
MIAAVISILFSTFLMGRTLEGSTEININWAVLDKLRYNNGTGVNFSNTRKEIFNDNDESFAIHLHKSFTLWTGFNSGKIFSHRAIHRTLFPNGLRSLLLLGSCFFFHPKTTDAMRVLTC